MANHTSQLVVRLRDEVTGPAGRAARSLKGLKNEARGSIGMGSLTAGMARAGIAVGGTALGVYGIARGLKDAYTEAAAFDRQMTRIGITADASIAATKGASNQVRGIAREVAIPVNQVVEGLDALVAQGRTLPDALAFLPSVARTAQASGAAVADMAHSAGSLESQFKITADSMQLAFDMMAAGGKAGQFELKDMASEFPSLAAQAASLGFKGTDGLATLVSALQMVRKNTGTAGEAATSLSDVFGKMESKDTIKNFKKHFGIDLTKSFAKARKEGRNLFEVFEEAIVKITEKDLSNVNKVFQDKEARRGALALAQYAQERKKLDEQIRKESGGTVVNDLSRVTGDAQASVDNLANSWDRFKNSLGTGLDAAGVSSGLNAISDSLERHVNGLEKNNKAMSEAANLRRIAREDMEKEGQQRKRFDPFASLPSLQPPESQAERDKKTLEALGANKTVRDNIGVGRGNYLLKDRSLNLNDLTSSDNEEIRKVGAQRYLEQQRAQAAAYHDGDRLAAQRKAGELNDLATRQRAGGHYGLRDTERKLFMVDHDLEVMRRTAQGKMSRSGAAYPWAGDDSEARGVTPKTAPLPPPRPAVDTTDLEAAKGKAAEVEQAIQALGVTVAPAVDSSSLDATQAKADKLLATINQIGAASSRVSVPSAGGSSRDLGQQFSSRRSGSYADFEHS